MGQEITWEGSPNLNGADNCTAAFADIFSQPPLSEVDQKLRSFCAHKVKIKILTSLSVRMCPYTQRRAGTLLPPTAAHSQRMASQFPTSPELCCSTPTIAFPSLLNTPSTLSHQNTSITGSGSCFPLSLQSQPRYPLQEMWWLGAGGQSRAPSADPLHNNFNVPQPGSYPWRRCQSFQHGADHISWTLRDLIFCCVVFCLVFFKTLFV